MATFYLLPPRACLEDSLCGLLSRFLPGLPLPADTWDVVSDRVAAGGGWPADVFLIPRDDLPPGERVVDVLTGSFGAEPGDRVVEVNGSGPGAREWVVAGGMSASVGAR